MLLDPPPQLLAAGLREIHLSAEPPDPTRSGSMWVRALRLGTLVGPVSETHAFSGWCKGMPKAKLLVGLSPILRGSNGEGFSKLWRPRAGCFVDPVMFP